MAGVGVAEGEVEPVVGGEARERVGGADNLADPSADARGVVKHQPGGHAPAELEHGLQASQTHSDVSPQKHCASDTLENGKVTTR